MRRILVRRVLFPSFVHRCSLVACGRRCADAAGRLNPQSQAAMEATRAFVERAQQQSPQFSLSGGLSAEGSALPLLLRSLQAAANVTPLTSESQSSDGGQIARALLALLDFAQREGSTKEEEGSPRGLWLVESGIYDVLRACEPLLCLWAAMFGEPHATKPTELALRTSKALPPSDASMSQEKVTDEFSAKAVVVLQLVQSALVLPRLPEDLLPCLRRMLLPALAAAQKLNIEQLACLGVSLAQTRRAVADAEEAPLSNGGTTSGWEDQQDLKVFWRAAAVAMESCVARQNNRKDFAKSAAFAFSLAERKKREREGNSSTLDHSSAASSACDIHQLAELSTALGVTGCSDSRVWSDVVALAETLVRESALRAKNALDGDLPPVNFSLKDVQSICFALHSRDEGDLYDMFMRRLVEWRVVGHYIARPR